jgi:hypothetical protein
MIGGTRLFNASFPNVDGISAFYTSGVWTLRVTISPTNSWSDFLRLNTTVCDIRAGVLNCDRNAVGADAPRFEHGGTDAIANGYGADFQTTARTTLLLASECSFQSRLRKDYFRVKARHLHWRTPYFVVRKTAVQEPVRCRIGCSAGLRAVSGDLIASSRTSFTTNFITTAPRAMSRLVNHNWGARNAFSSTEFTFNPRLSCRNSAFRPRAFDAVVRWVGVCGGAPWLNIAPFVLVEARRSFAECAGTDHAAPRPPPSESHVAPVNDKPRADLDELFPQACR